MAENGRSTQQVLIEALDVNALLIHDVARLARTVRSGS